ncbi:MAG: S1 RNA-binding domain-containing protein, partial [Sedimentisphaerales bacterium]|nr:S1 RNA-binding domain-containing protein [Sedimentisphaerales bacterium]
MNDSENNEHGREKSSEIKPQPYEPSTPETEQQHDRPPDKPVEPESVSSEPAETPAEQGESTDAVADSLTTGTDKRNTGDIKDGFLPDSEEEAIIDSEVEEALGDISLMDIYGLEQKDASAQDSVSATPEDKPDEKTNGSQPTSESESESLPPGINRGMVISIADDGVFVDLGGKSQGFLPTEELDEEEKIEVGADIDVAILRYDARDGLLILSRKTAEQQFLRRDLREGSTVEARVTGSNKGGLEMDIKGLKAFMPASQIDMVRIEDFDSLLNQRFVCEVIQVERGDKNIVLSRRKVLEKDELERRENLWRELEVGQLRHGTVRSLTDYGAFVDLGGMDGLLHISEMSWARIKHPKDILEVGQGIDVIILEKNDERYRLSLSLRKAGGDPWTRVAEKYTVGSRHQGQITNLMNFGAFAELEPGVEGLIPISEMSWAGRVRHPSDIVKTGMIVDVEILKIDVEKRRISLSMKSFQENPWAGVPEKYIKNNIYTGRVSRLTDFGAFITLEPGIDGLLHISEASDKHLNNIGDVLSNDQEIQVKILSMDAEQQRIALTLKGLGQT